MMIYQLRHLQKEEKRSEKMLACLLMGYVHEEEKIAYGLWRDFGVSVMVGSSLYFFRIFKILVFTP